MAPDKRVTPGLVVNQTPAPQWLQQFVAVGGMSAQAVESVFHAMHAWSCPPELQLPTPRPVFRAPLRTRLLYGAPRLVGLVLVLVFLATCIYWFGYLSLAPHGRPATPPFRALLDWLHAPSWRPLTSWPTAAYAVVAGWIIGFRQIKRGRQHALERRLLQGGSPAIALLAPYSFDANGELTLTPVRQRWNLEYRDSAGTLMKAFVDRRAIPSRSSVLTVLFDPAHPQQFVFYPVVSYVIRI